jgi:glucose-1-phosphate thymidylyltransferase
MLAPLGIVPAAGRGSRLGLYRATKELIQVGYETVETDDGATQLVPKAAIDHVLGAMRRGGVRSAFVVLSPVKWEIFRYLGSGELRDMDVAYLCQEESQGMPHALDLAHPFVGDRTVCMGMPDTLVAPADCFAQLLAFHDKRGADLSLGLFPVADPRSFAPVVLDPVTGRVVDILEKPEVPPVSTIWGIAAWSPAFGEFLHEFVRTAKAGPAREGILSEAFLQSAQSGLEVFGLPFDTGHYHDIGTPAGLAQVRRRFESGQGEPA